MSDSSDPYSSSPNNTTFLGRRIVNDVISAATAAFLAAPIIAIVDRSIIENASGRASIRTSVSASVRQLFLKPHRFLLSKPFGLVFMVYSTTYFAANTVDTVYSSLDKGLSPAYKSAGTAKFAASSATNMSASLVKDANFTKIFGPSNIKPRPVAPASIILYALRDSLTIFASFNAPSRIAPYIPLSRQWQQDWFSNETFAQFVAPAAIQFVSTPLHLLGLDLYNRPQQHSAAARMRTIGSMWIKSSLMRICRIVPAFGFGGVVNSKVRYRLMSQLPG